MSSTRKLPPEASLQPPLFANDRVVQRVLSTGTIIRVRLEPLAEGQVRILEYHRRDHTGKWQRRSEEEQRTVSFATLGLAGSFSEIFGSCPLAS